MISVVFIGLGILIYFTFLIALMIYITDIIENYENGLLHIFCLIFCLAIVIILIIIGVVLTQMILEVGG